jgi:diguanylate cyclase (GGDEF)-like protein
LQKRELILNESTALFLRAGLLLSLLAAIATTPLSPPHPRLLVYLLWGGLGYGLITTGLFFAAARYSGIQVSRSILVALDIGLITALLWAAGPQHNSLFARMYYIPIICAAIWFGARACYLTFAGTFIIYLTLNLCYPAKAGQNWPAILAALFCSLVITVMLGLVTTELSARRQVTDSLRSALERLTATYNVAHAGGGAISLEEIVLRVLAEIGQLAKAQTCFVALLDKTGEFQINTSEGGKATDFCREPAEEALLTKAPHNVRWPAKNAPENTDYINIFTLPLGTAREVMGIVQLQRSAPFKTKEKEALEALCREAAEALENAYLRAELHQLATTDSVTGLYNRAQLQRQLEKEAAKSQRYGHPLSLLMLDIDGFKLVNDYLGHSAGDRALCLLTAVLKNELRLHDTPCRWGGDEFCILLPETTLEGSIAVADRLRSRFKIIIAEQLAEAVRLPIPITLSVGIISNSDGLLTAGQLLTFADRALYAAKRGGKNQVKAFLVGNEIAPPTHGILPAEEKAEDAACQAR